ncbi:DUF1810 domain-containing protein [Paucibacter sp. R3-3]|uniref:DUF1810 domain-containing protein n=1 Tax=Roseateles agri TaxID=3098619 RepID=A0ABU5DBG0_9BURK|nr:DUF1810 domain-containing protein [Paucibacter sp. R3-3]MDY0743454.1 DUF1810 domain-containing protein [Paucibacter sp. R3-3]
MTEALDPFDLQRFVDAQARNYEDALAEFRAGRKTTHWSWYVIPQLAGLGTSPMAKRYAVQSLDEAKAYLAHPLLGARLRECVAAMNALDAGTSAEQVLGGIDARKFQSCLTLFDCAAGGTEPLFRTALDRFYDGQPDDASLRLLVSAAPSPGSPAPR